MLSVGESIERAKEQAIDVAKTCAAMQREYNPGSTPATFLGTAAAFSSVAVGAFRLASRLDSESTPQRLKKLSIGSIGVGAGVLAALDFTTYKGLHLLDQEASPSSEPGDTPMDLTPTSLERMMDGDLFQQHVLHNKILPVRAAGIALVMGHAILEGYRELGAEEGLR